MGEEIRPITDPLQVTQRFYQLVATATPGRTTAELSAMLAESDIAGGAVLDLEQHLIDPQIAHNGTYEIVDDPHVGQLRKVRYPARWRS